MIPDLRVSDRETTVDFEVEPVELVAATVFKAGEFEPGLEDLVVRGKEREGLGETEPRGGKGSFGSGGSGGSGRGLSPGVKRDENGAEALCGGNQQFAIHWYCYGALLCF